jgi:hypothetical protein
VTEYVKRRSSCMHCGCDISTLPERYASALELGAARDRELWGRAPFDLEDEG